MRTLVIYLLLISIYPLCYAAKTRRVVGKNGYQLKTVVIDPGHGGYEGGACGLRYKEKDLTLQIATKLGKLIKRNQPNVKVVFTRTKDQYLTLGARTRIANGAKGDLFISIHCNASLNKKMYGLEVYVMGDTAVWPSYGKVQNLQDAHLSVAKRENNVILLEKDYQKSYSDFNSRNPGFHILHNTYKNAYFQNSMKMARYIEQEGKRKNRRSNGIRQDGILVLWKTIMPSVLVELDYLSNPQEEAFMGSLQGQQQLVEILYTAFVRYKNNLERK